MFCRVNLYNRRGPIGDCLVQTVTMPIYRIRPEVIMWGARCFHWEPHTKRYIETLAVTAVCDGEGKSMLQLTDESFPTVDDVQLGAKILKEGEPIPLHKSYRPLPVACDLSQSGVVEAIKEIGHTDLYSLHVQPMELDLARSLVPGILEELVMHGWKSTVSIHCYQNQCLRSREWFVVGVGRGGGVAVGSPPV